MLEVGNFNELEVSQTTLTGVFLKSEQGDILLSKKDVPEGIQPGDRLNVFIYTTRDELLATTQTPKAKVGEFAYLKVKDVTRYGAFLDWGLDKDLFVPFNEQRRNGMKQNEKYIVRIYLDKITKRITATEKIQKFIETDVIPFYTGEKVNLLVYEFTDLGVTVIINNLYLGVIYNTDLYRNLQIGEQTIGYISKVRPDKKIDVTLRKTGRAAVEDGKDKILAKLKENGGFLPLNDNSSPEMIRKHLQMSKKKFKMSIGGLYKARLIQLTDEGIRLQ